MELAAVYAPGHGGEPVAGVAATEDPGGFVADVVAECAPPDAVMGNLEVWRSRGMHAVVGTSGFTEERLAELRTLWGEDGPGCLVVPNFSIGAVLMMRVAEMAAPHFETAEVVERHHADKPDAPSGTALATAMRMGAAGASSAELSRELVPGARGASTSGVRVHSLRLAGVLSAQEVAFSNDGEEFSVVHRSTSYGSFVGGALVAIRYVQSVHGVAVGLDAALGI
jgi:4-hydroxy-tetrahydrodipicolinate reductase